MFSSDVKLHFSKQTNNSKTTAESSSVFTEHILNGSSIHGIAACSYITAHLIVQY